ncbi:MAG: SMC-Scp complex subunit ScpB, partial [Gammaproteobacteria bacterium]
AADVPRNINQLLALFDNDQDRPEREELVTVVGQLQEDYADRGVELREVASGYRFQVKSDYADWVNRLYDEKPQRYSRAFMETLAIIAYRQPITRSEIEDVRGVSVSSGIIKSLQEREWVRVVGHRDVPGKPELLATTKEFLDYFNLKKLSELPPLSEIKDFDHINPDLFESLDTKDGQAEEQVDDATADNAEVVTSEDDTAQESEDNVVPFSG